MKTELGKTYDHNPDHYKFRRQIEGYEPDANNGDWIVFGVATAIVSGVVFWMFVYHLANWLFGP